MSDENLPTAEQAADSAADAKAVIAIIAVIVTTAAFWLLGQ